jgi:hypothetical protein
MSPVFLRSPLAALCVCITLGACGGGGGGGSDPEPPASGYTPESSVALAISSDNLGAAVIVPTVYAEALQALAVDTAGWVERFAATPRPTSPWACNGGGSLTAAWNDNDGNGQLSLGDSLTLDLADCVASASASRFSGTLRVVIVAPRDARALAARVTIATGLRFAEADVQGAWKGSFTVERLRLERSREMLMTASLADQLRLELTVLNVLAVDRFEALDLWRAVSDDWQANFTEYSMTLASDVLRGKVSMSTPTTLLSYFDTYPRQGVIEVAGSGRAQASATAGGPLARYALLEGAGAGTTGSQAWNEFVQGLIWVGPGTLPQQYGEVRELSTVAFDYVGDATVEIDPSRRSAVWQFNRGVTFRDPVTAVRLVRSGDGWGPVSIDGSVEVSGGRLLVRWAQQLEPGARYAVEWLNGNGTPTFPSGFVRTGNAGDEYASVQTPAQLIVTETLSAAIGVPSNAALLLPETVLRLDGSSSRSSGGAVATYRWTQTSGIPLQLSGSDQPALDITLPPSFGAPPSDIEIQLEVADALGVTDRQPVRFQAVPSPSTSVLGTLRGSPGDPLLNGAASGGAAALWTAARLASGSSLFVRAFVNFGAPIGTNSIFFFLPAGAALQPGTYAAPASAFERGDNAGLLMNTSNSSCTGPASFTIHEAEVGVPDGSIDGTPITRFAADFTVSCSGAPTVSGAVRIGSARPLPP